MIVGQFGLTRWVRVSASHNTSKIRGLFRRWHAASHGELLDQAEAVMLVGPGVLCSVNIAIGSQVIPSGHLHYGGDYYGYWSYGQGFQRFG